MKESIKKIRNSYFKKIILFYFVFLLLDYLYGTFISETSTNSLIIMAIFISVCVSLYISTNIFEKILIEKKVEVLTDDG